MNAKPLVLVADDEPDIRQLVRRVRAGLATVEAGLISLEELHRVVPR